MKYIIQRRAQPSDGERDRKIGHPWQRYTSRTYRTPGEAQDEIEDFRSRPTWMPTVYEFQVVPEPEDAELREKLAVMHRESQIWIMLACALGMIGGFLLGVVAATRYFDVIGCK